MKHISSIASGVALGSAGLVMMSLLSGCESKQEEQKQQNKFLVIEQQGNGKYVVVENMPTEGPSRAIIREKDADGKVTERILSQDEMKALAGEEYKKVQDGTSETVTGSHSEGMGLAGTILAAAGGAIMGNMIANALMGNKNFSQNAAASNKSAYSRSAPSGGTPSSAPSSSSSPAKKSYFGSSGTSATSGSTSGSSTSSSTSSGS
ncbi:MAG: hypothetical protein WC656_06530 [Sulfurimonas sp.]|jgi:hypothetical protein